jgi:predicted ATP-grasp superfamily ATP-dependent carboligase
MNYNGALKQKFSDLVISVLRRGYVESPQGFIASRSLKVNVSGYFLLVETFLNLVLFESMENIILIKFW